jgi:hypothetical protein
VIGASWRRLSRHDRRAVAAVLLAQVIIAAGVRLVSVRSLVRAVAACRGGARSVVRRGEDDRVAWAIESVGRRLPGVSTCLVRALTADLFLSGPNSTGCVWIGVRRSPDGALESHAWFEREGRIVVGGATAPTYVELTTLQATRSERA